MVGQDKYPDPRCVDTDSVNRIGDGPVEGLKAELFTICLLLVSNKLCQLLLYADQMSQLCI